MSSRAVVTVVGCGCDRCVKGMTAFTGCFSQAAVLPSCLLPSGSRQRQAEQHVNPARARFHRLLSCLPASCLRAAGNGRHALPAPASCLQAAGKGRHALSALAGQLPSRPCSSFLPQQPLPSNARRQRAFITGARIHSFFFVLYVCVFVSVCARVCVRVSLRVSERK